jgi:hypothetical protein
MALAPQETTPKTCSCGEPSPVLMFTLTLRFPQNLRDDEREAVFVCAKCKRACSE